MTQVPPTFHTGAPIAPHRGVLILIFGILGLVLCVLFGVAAWIMGNKDLREMDAGRMDPSGRGMVQAGRILGIIAVCLVAALAAIYIVLMLLGVAAAVAGAAI
jgi:hypothetical protein